MVNWRDPNVVDAETVALIKFVHVIGGIYIWEFVSQLGFEYSVFTKKRKFTWSFLLYLGCRWFPLFAITSQFLGLDVSHKIDCQVWIIMTFVFGNLSFACASALVILRVAAIWDLNKLVVSLSFTVWLGNITAFAYSMIPLRSTWIGSCIISQTNLSKISVLSAFVTDIILLVLMLTGLMRWKHAQNASGVWRLLRRQCLIWIAIVTLAGVPATVFAFLNLNDPFNLIFQVLAVIITALGAARIHRELVDYPAFNCSTQGTDGNEWANEVHSGPVSPPMSHQSCQTKRGRDSVSVVLDALPVMTSSTEARRARDV